MAWPKQIYVATTALGVYYTADFVDPSTQPTWTAVNTGLPALDCREFWLDPFNPAGLQYVMLEANRTLYRRNNGGAWTEILTEDLAKAVVDHNDLDDALYSFCVDPSVSGRLWALYRHFDNSRRNTVCALRSDDWGASWEYTGPVGGGIVVYGVYFIRAHGDNVYVTGSWDVGAALKVAYSTNGGVSFTEYRDGNTFTNPCILNPLLPNQIYTTTDLAGNTDLARVTNTGVVTAPLQDGLGPGRSDAMWFDPDDANHQRLIRDGRIYVTADEWANVNSPSAISPPPISFAPWSGDDTDQIQWV